MTKVSPSLARLVYHLQSRGLSGRRIALHSEIPFSRATVHRILSGEFDHLLELSNPEPKPDPPLPHDRCPVCGHRGYLMAGLCVACRGEMERAKGKPDHAGLETVDLELPDDPDTQRRYQEAQATAQARQQEQSGDTVPAALRRGMGFVVR